MLPPSRSDQQRSVGVNDSRTYDGTQCFWLEEDDYEKENRSENFQKSGYPAPACMPNNGFTEDRTKYGSASFPQSARRCPG